MRKLFTSESVTEGHPDKLCDNISDSILDSYLARDKNSRVAAEVLAGKGEITVAGEITSSANVDIEKIVRDTLKIKEEDSLVLFSSITKKGREEIYRQIESKLS